VHRKDVDVNWMSRDGLTPLLRATANGNHAIVKLLLKNGANLNEQGGGAVWQRSSGGFDGRQ
jgi:ankyrin repeat protein